MGEGEVMRKHKKIYAKIDSLAEDNKRFSEIIGNHKARLDELTDRIEQADLRVLVAHTHDSVVSPTPDPKFKVGDWVKFDTHVAAVKAATGTALQEETEAYDHGYCIGYAAGYSRGIVGVGKGLGDFCQVDECAGCGE